MPGSRPWVERGNAAGSRGIASRSVGARSWATRRFVGCPGGPRVTAYLLRSEALPERWSELDQFEGSAYCRILVPFYSVRGLRAVGYLYAIAPRPHPDENRHGPMAPADEEV